MKKLNRDELYSIAMQLDLRDLLHFSAASKFIEKLCNKNYLWMNLLNRDFKDRKEFANNNYKDLYILLWNLRDLKQQMNLEEDIYRIYSAKKLVLDDKKLTKIPSSIRFLTNLKELRLENNNLKKLPDYLPNSLKYIIAHYNQLKNLSNCFPPLLEGLFCSNNNIKKIPDNLPNSLRHLNVSRNHIKKLPTKLPDSLRNLFIGCNQLKELPTNLPIYLEDLYLDKNNIEELPDNLPQYLRFLSIVDNNHLKVTEIKRIKTLYPNLAIREI